MDLLANKLLLFQIVSRDMFTYIWLWSSHLLQVSREMCINTLTIVYVLSTIFNAHEHLHVLTTTFIMINTNPQSGKLTEICMEVNEYEIVAWKGWIE